MYNLKFITLLLSVVFLTSCASQKIDRVAPELYTATFETTKGNFDIEIKREWSPVAADRLYNLLKNSYYDNTPFYRVVPNFVAQFGSTDSLQMKKWSAKVPDEPVLYGNKKGAISFARDGKESRGTDLFINIKNNTYLDTVDYNGVKGFPAFGNVTKGMEVVEKLYSGYGDKTMEDEALFADPEGLLKAFPELDIIKKAYITSKK
ncbi:MAG: peptidylprolyl isomerase [Bacteroidota bacterium]